MKIYTIGFTKKSAESFFETLKRAGVKRLVDVRIHNSGQLAGFSKKDDLEYFLKTICGIEYLHMPELGPTEELFTWYKKFKGKWAEYEKLFVEMLGQRRIENVVDKKTMDGACLLCVEDWPDHCHRRLVAEYLEEKWPSVEIEHLV
jgi:uncharacterized protein (DUF488 family)